MVLQKAVVLGSDLGYHLRTLKASADANHCQKNFLGAVQWH
jgi:hypothetical protein